MRGYIFLIIFGLLFKYGDSVKFVNGTCPSRNDTVCKPGVLFGVWKPVDNISYGDVSARAFVYMAGLIYLFLGVSIIADRFMASIEVITSKERKVVVKKSNGETQIINVRIWNETVSNLTLMALGSSAPEILLSIIEIVGNNFEPGDLGPGTIVGSAAFNLFVIIGYCVYVIPNGEVRRIKHLSVFFITATWSVFAYLWLYLIIAVITPGTIDIWEGLLTFFYFFLTVLTAYIADTKKFVKGLMKRRYLKRNVKSYAADANEHEMHCNHHGEEGGIGGGYIQDENLTELEKTRMDFIEIIRELRQKNPNIDPRQLEEMAQIEVLNRVPKSRAYYRMQATRQLTGSGNVIKKSKVERRLSIDAEKSIIKDIDNNNQKIFFDPGHYTVMENVGVFYITVSREGTEHQITNTRVEVDFTTEDGSATAGDDYIATSGTLEFQPGELHKLIEISIIDDEIFEEDEHFYVKLNKPKLIGSSGNVGVGENSHGQMLQVESDGGVELREPSTATVMVLDDDHAGIFHFEVEEQTVSESCGDAEIKVCRSSGARGVVLVPYRTISATATGGKDYIEVTSYLEFINDQTEAYIKVSIIDDNEYEKDEHFVIELGEPVVMKKPDGHRMSLIGKELLSPSEMVFSSHDSKSDKPPPYEDIDEKPSEISNHTEDKIALLKNDNNNNNNNNNNKDVVDLGKPKLGEPVHIKVIIKESMEFKHVVDNLLKHGNLSDFVGTSSWKEQFIEAITVSPGEGNDCDENECAEEKLPSCMDYVMHFLTLFWKVLFAFVPPTDYLGGWLSFTVCIFMIGFLTAIIGDFASGFGCTVGLTNAVTAITFVALGTSLPDTFASKVAAINDDSADSSVGNVTGSNAVNVFLGIGLAWSIAAIASAARGKQFNVPAGSLGFSVTVFCLLAFVAIMIMLIRRHPKVGGELGGPKKYKVITTVILIGFWMLYVVLSSLENYCHIEGF